MYNEDMASTDYKAAILEILPEYLADPEVIAEFDEQPGYSRDTKGLEAWIKRAYMSAADYLTTTDDDYRVAALAARELHREHKAARKGQDAFEWVRRF